MWIRVTTSNSPNCSSMTIYGDRVVFDYRLRPGVVQRGNALALMRAIGLM